MTGSSNKILLRKFLKGHVDEQLFDYVAHNANNVLFYSFEQLCDRANVSQEELHAFFRAFGVDSLNAFKEFLRNVIYYEATPLGVVKRPLTSLADEVIRYEIKNLTDYAERLDCELLERLAKDILSASEVIVFGSRVAKTYSDTFANYLNRLGVKARTFNAPWDDSTYGYLNTLDSNAIVIAFGVARYHNDDILRMKQLRDRGIHTVGITDHVDSPFALFSDYFLSFPIQSLDFLDSYTAGMTVVNLLVLSIGMQDERKMITSLNAHDAMAEDMGLFV